MAAPEPQDVGPLDSYSTRPALTLRFSYTERRRSLASGLTRGMTYFRKPTSQASID
jgi:hypothetical protein